MEPLLQLTKQACRSKLRSHAVADSTATSAVQHHPQDYFGRINQRNYTSGRL
jgi:hypothetical protein